MVVFAYYLTANQLTLSKSLDVVFFDQEELNIINKQDLLRGDGMAENKTENYFEDKKEGHLDTREANFKCENPDPILGCDMGIDVAG